MKQVILAIGQHRQNKRRTDFTLDLIHPTAKLFVCFDDFILIGLLNSEVNQGFTEKYLDDDFLINLVTSC